LLSHERISMQDVDNALLVPQPEYCQVVSIGPAEIEDHEIGAVLTDRLEDLLAGATAG
jgi:hypothetical protein